MNIINEREQSNGNNIVVESSAANNHVNHYAFNPNGLRYYYNIHNESKNFIYIVFNLLVWASYITGLFYLDELSIEKVSPNYHPFFFWNRILLSRLSRFKIRIVEVFYNVFCSFKYKTYYL